MKMKYCFFTCTHTNRPYRAPPATTASTNASGCFKADSTVPRTRLAMLGAGAAKTLTANTVKTTQTNRTILHMDCMLINVDKSSIYLQFLK